MLVEGHGLLRRAVPASSSSLVWGPLPDQTAWLDCAGPSPQSVLVPGLPGILTFVQEGFARSLAERGSTCLSLGPGEAPTRVGCPVRVSRCLVRARGCTRELSSRPRRPGPRVCPDPPALLPPQGKELLAQKLPLWQQACADPNKVPDRAVQLLQQVAGSNGAILPGTLSASKSNLVISDPIPGAKPLPVPPELAPFVGVSLGSRKLYGCGGTVPLCSSRERGALLQPAPLPPLPHSGCLPRRTRPS